MPHTELTLTPLRAPSSPARVVVLAPGLGTAVHGTWDETAEHLNPASHVIAVDLPGHGRSPAWNSELTRPNMEALALAVKAAVKPELERDSLQGLPVHFAGISLSGGLGLQLALGHHQLFTSVAVICSAAKIGQPQAWAERAAAVRSDGAAPLVEGSLSRWFAPGFVAANPEKVDLLVSALRATDAESYALHCETVGAFDVVDRLGEIGIPLLVIAGEHDAVTPPQLAEEIGAGVSESEIHVLRDTAHQAPTEKPQDTARLLNAFFV